ncbi:hypothetical protein ATY41_08730 [Leifsonia xyli subsp. xyli]|uniref:FHA domain-containing protein n=1 Tax=Leifsonia xyli subsp. xyli TaxID=59736 RepID=A0A1E2SM64_LEIXY|nr:FHA domain-containing protein [Leifsonia xyli]ODA90724.1 hypothetical protein ATY41_08730 [Leifsonia xyli subsp. xyli]
MTPGFTRYAPAAGPSRWLFVAGRRFVACIESAIADSVLDEVWRLADSELATIESVVGAFPLAGPGSVRSFAVADLGEPNAAGENTVTAVVRGSAAIDVFSVGGARRFGAGGVQPWVLAEFRSVSGLVLGGEDLPTGPVARLGTGSLPLGLGVVGGELLTWSLSPIDRAERSAPRPEALSEGSKAGAGETVIPAPSQGSSLFAYMTPPEEAGARMSADGLMAAKPHPVAHELPGTVDIEAPAGAPSDARYPPLADESAPTAPVRLPPAPVSYAIRIGSGDDIPLDVPVLLGRRPTVRGLDSGVAPRLLPVPSPTQEVSGTHLRIEQSGDAAVVTDLRSTNGTVVLRPGAQAVQLRPGESAVVLAGTVVEIGDGNIIEIIAAPIGDRREEGPE